MWDYTNAARWFNKTSLIAVLAFQVYVLRYKPDTATNEQMGVVYASTLVAL